MDSAMCGGGGVGLISRKKFLFVTLVWTTIITGHLAAVVTEEPSDVTTSINDVTTSLADVTTSLHDVTTSLHDVTTSNASLSDVTASINDVITKQNVTDDAVAAAETTGRGKGCVNASVPCTNITTVEITTTQGLTATQIGDTAATLSTSSSGSNDSTITSTTVSDAEVTSDGSLTTVPVLYTGSSQNDSFSSVATDPSVPETTPTADQSTSEGMLSTVSTPTTDLVSDFSDNVTVATPSSSGNVSDWLANLPVMVNDTLGGNASVLIGANDTSFMGIISREGDIPLDMNRTATPGVSGFNLSTDLNATGTGAGHLTTPTNDTDLSNATVPDLPSSFNATDMSAVFPTGFKDNMTSSLGTVQPPTDTTLAESATADFVDPFSFHIDPNTPPPPSPTTPGMVDTGHNTVEEDPSALAAWWPVVGGDSAQENTTESNHTATEPEVPQDPSTPINDTFPLPDLISSSSFSTTFTPLITTTVPQLSFENATDNLILPDESKNVEMLGVVEGAGQEPLPPSVDAKVEPVTQATPSFQPDPPPAMEPNLILEPEGVKKPKPIVEPETPFQKLEKPVVEPGVPAGIPDSSWWPGGEGKKKEKGGKTSSGHGGPDLLDKFQMVFLVAPCVGALLAVIGAACALRCATANCRKRRKLIRKLKKQQKEEEKKRKEEEKKRQEEKKKEKEEKKNAKQAEVTEENETEQKGHRKRKHHHHRDNHHRDNHHHDKNHNHHEHNGHTPAEEQEHKSVKKSHK